MNDSSTLLRCVTRSDGCIRNRAALEKCYESELRPVRSGCHRSILDRQEHRSQHTPCPFFSVILHKKTCRCRSQHLAVVTPYCFLMATDNQPAEVPEVRAMPFKMMVTITLLLYVFLKSMMNLVCLKHRSLSIISCEDDDNTVTLPFYSREGAE